MDTVAERLKQRANLSLKIRVPFVTPSNIDAWMERTKKPQPSSAEEWEVAIAESTLLWLDVERLNESENARIANEAALFARGKSLELNIPDKNLGQFLRTAVTLKTYELLFALLRQRVVGWNAETEFSDELRDTFFETLSSEERAEFVRQYERAAFRDKEQAEKNG